MQPDLNRLRVFFHVYSHLSITNAAQEMYLTPSAVSQQLKKLEQEIRTPLFTRLHKQLVPTPAGKKLYDLVSPLITGLQSGIALMERELTEPSGLLKIGAPLEFGTIYLPSVIAGFRRRYENVAFHIEIGRPSILKPKVIAGDLDFAFVDTFPTRDNFEQETAKLSLKPVIEEQVVLACSREYNHLHLQDNHSLDSLLNCSYLSQQQDTRSLYKWFLHHFQVQPKQLNIVLTVANHQAILSGIRHHLGLGVIVPHIVWEEVLSGEIVIVRHREKQAINQISLLQLQDRVPTLREKVFLSHFLEAVQKSRTLNRFGLSISN